MTAKEALLDLVGGLDDRTAEDVLSWLGAGDNGTVSPPTESELEAAERGAQQIEAGLGIPHAEIRWRFGLAGEPMDFQRPIAVR